MSISERLYQLSSTRAPFWLLLLMVILIFIMQVLSPPPSIVPFEFASTFEEAEAWLRKWGYTGQRQAIIQTYVDFLFLMVYATTLALFCFRLAREQEDFYRSISLFLGWSMFVAGLLDAIENVAMLQTLYGNQSDFFPLLSSYTALGKFLIIGIGFIYLTLSGLYLLFNWLLLRFGDL
jgi:hypothetical protein